MNHIQIDMTLFKVPKFGLIHIKMYFLFRLDSLELIYCREKIGLLYLHRSIELFLPLQPMSLS